MVTFEEWWTMDNMLLVHGLNTGAETKGEFERDPTKPIPKKGELACSIMAPYLPLAYASVGVILRPALPTRLSYTDVGSFYRAGTDAAIAARVTKGRVWSPSEMSMEMAVYLSLATGSYNEVLVPAHETEVVGVYAIPESVDTQVEGLVRALHSPPERVDEAYCLTMAHALLAAEVYVHKPSPLDQNQDRWHLQDLLGKGITHAGYESMPALAEALVSGVVNLDELFGRAGPDVVSLEGLFNGGFFEQPVLSDHKQALREALVAYAER